MLALTYVNGRKHRKPPANYYGAQRKRDPPGPGDTTANSSYRSFPSSKDLTYTPTRGTQNIQEAAHEAPSNVTTSLPPYPCNRCLDLRFSCAYRLDLVPRDIPL